MKHRVRVSGNYSYSWYTPEWTEHVICASEWGGGGTPRSPRGSWTCVFGRITKSAGCLLGLRFWQPWSTLALGTQQVLERPVLLIQYVTQRTFSAPLIGMVASFSVHLTRHLYKVLPKGHPSSLSPTSIHCVSSYIILRLTHQWEKKK